MSNATEYIASEPIELANSVQDRDWLLLPPGVTQLQTMAAALIDLKVSFSTVHVLSVIGVFNDAMKESLDIASQSLGFEYRGNYLNTLMDFHIVPQSLTDTERQRWHINAEEFVADQLEKHFPDLRKYRGLRVIATVRPNMPEDFFLLSALNPSRLVLVADGIQNEVIIRRRQGDEWRGFNREISNFPTLSEIYCPHYLFNDTTSIGAARPISATALDLVISKLRSSDLGQHLHNQVLSSGRLPQAIVLSQHFALSSLCSEDQEFAYYAAILQYLVNQHRLPILFKRHPRDPFSKSRRLMEHFSNYAEDIVFTDDLASCFPIECLSDIWAGSAPMLIGSSSSALLGLRSSLDGPAYCADADFLPDPMRQQIILFSLKNHIPRMTFDSDLC